MNVNKQQVKNLHHLNRIEYYLNRYQSYQNRAQEYFDYVSIHCRELIKNNQYIKPERKLNWYQKYKIKTNKFRYAIVIPSRKRTNLLAHCLASIDEHTKYKDRTVIFLEIDEDDKETIQYIENRKNPIKIFAYAHDRTDYLSGYYNKGAMEVCGVDNWFVWGFNDDAEILTKNWDQILNETITEHRMFKPDGIDYIFTNVFDGKSTIDNFCPFPLISTKCIRLLGFLLPPEIYTHGADIALYDIYKDLCIPSVLKTSIQIAHNSINDMTHGEMLKIANQHRCHLTELEINRYRDILDEGIISYYES